MTHTPENDIALLHEAMQAAWIVVDDLEALDHPQMKPILEAIRAQAVQVTAAYHQIKEHDHAAQSE